MRLRDLHRLNRRRKVGPRRHPIPDLVQVALQILFLERLQRLPVHPGRALIPFHLSPGVPHLHLRDVERLARRLLLVPATPPERSPVARTNTATNDPAPSLHPHYTLTTTVFSQRSMRRFEASPRRATPKGQTFISRTAPHQETPTYRPAPLCVRDTRCGSFDVTRMAVVTADT